MLHYSTEKFSMHLIGRICSIRRFDFSSIIVEQLYISERKKKSCIRNRTQRTSNPRFQWKYSYHTDHSENPERPNSSNILPMSRVMLGCGILRFNESQYFSGELEGIVGLR